MGLWRQVTAAAIAERLGQLISDYKKRAQMQQSCRAITDGRGVSRVMEELFGK
jgi:spore coat polysaccharide biosynthesis predicted glycosyltransferase SpsG